MLAFQLHRVPRSNPVFLLRYATDFSTQCRIQLVIEESVESFILQYQAYAATVEVLPRIEGSPLLECLVGQSILHLLERTGPYGAKAGRAQVIINPTIESFELLESASKTFEANHLGHMKAKGLVLEQQQRNLVVDVGIPIVLSSLKDLPNITQGDWLYFESLAPIHGFVVPPAQRYRRGGDSDAESL